MKDFKSASSFSFKFIVFLVFSLLNISTVFAQQYFKWMDAQGSTHYTTTPPPKNAKNKGKVETYNWHVSQKQTPQSSNSSPSSDPTLVKNQTQTNNNEVANSNSNSSKTIPQPNNQTPTSNNPNNQHQH